MVPTTDGTTCVLIWPCPQCCLLIRATHSIQELSLTTKRLPGFSLAVFFCLGLVGALAARVSDYRLRVGTLTSTKKMVLLR